MDIFYASLLSLFVVVFSCSLRFGFFKSKLDVDVKPPPGGRGWPVIGETIEFVTCGRKGHPEKFIVDRMTKFSRHVFRTSLMLEDAAVFCGPEGNKFLFSNDNKLVQFWVPASVKKIIPSLKGVNQTVLKTVRNILKPETLREYVPIMDMVAQKHFETGWEGNDQILTHKLTKNFTFLVACKIFFSVDEPEWVNKLSVPFERLAPGLFSIPLNLPGTLFRRAINAGAFINKELTAIVKKRKSDLANGKASPTQDILSLMLCDDYGRLMAATEVADAIMGLMIGGYDSTSSTCTFIVKYLAELPEIYEEVYKEQIEIAKYKKSTELLNWEDLSKMKYSWNVACEVLRLVPPTQGTFREAISDLTYKGYSIPKGWKLYWSTNSTHKNPDFFPEPKMFDPSRFDSKVPITPYTYVPFGGGAHLCPGKEFARLEILVFIHHLVRRFKLKKVIPNEDVIFNLVQPEVAKGLPIHLHPHKPKN